MRSRYVNEQGADAVQCSACGDHLGVDIGRRTDRGSAAVGDGEADSSCMKRWFASERTTSDSARVKVSRGRFECDLGEGYLEQFSP